ncbi:MAG: tetratricopeptide repeat protein [Pyrinomonadaceae bacterium]
MPKRRKLRKSFISATVLFSVFFSSISVMPQDIVAADDITGGSSVFVFRESRKKPQRKAGGRVFRSTSARGDRSRLQTQIAANRKSRAAKAKANAAIASRNRARNSKAVQSAALSANADIMLESNSVDQAIASYREAIKQNPKNTDAAEGLSDALTAKAVEMAGDSNSAAALRLLEEAVKLDSRNDVAFAKLGEVQAANGQTASAVANYEKAVQINPELSSVYVPLGMAYLNAGEIAKADAASENAEKRGIKDVDAQNLKGMILFRQNKNADALAAFEKVLQMQAKNSTAKYYEGLLYDRMNQPDRSLDAFRETVAAEPAFTPAWFDLGVAYYNQGKYNEAADAYQQAIKFDDKNAEAHANLASTYRQLERYPEANAEYKLAEANGIKNDPDLYSEWGYCLGKTNEWDKSTAKLETARSLSPTAIDNTNAGWGYYNAAQADKAAKNDAEATARLQKGKTSLETAVKQDPKLDAAYMNLGSTDNALGDHEAAVAALNVALTLHSDWIIALNQLGLGYRGMNNLQAALTQFTRAVSLDGNYVYGLFNLGSTQNATGDKKGAKKTQDRLRKLNPALADQLGSIIAGRLIDEGTRRIRNKIPIRLPF